MLVAQDSAYEVALEAQAWGAVEELHESCQNVGLLGTVNESFIARASGVDCAKGQRHMDLPVEWTGSDGNLIELVVAGGGFGAVVDRSSKGRPSGWARGLEVRGANLWLATEGGGPDKGGLIGGDVLTLFGGVGCKGVGEYRDAAWGLDDGGAAAYLEAGEADIVGAGE